MPIFEISTIQSFRHKYVIEAESLEHAYDTVTMNEAEELTQQWLGEMIVDGREVTREEIEQLTKQYMDDENEVCGDLETAYYKVEY